MIRFLKYSFIVLIIPFCVLFAGYEVNTNSKGISILIDSLDYSFVQHSDNSNSIRINQNDCSLWNTTSEYDVDELRVMLAIPVESKITYRILEKQNLTVTTALHKLPNPKNEYRELKQSVEIIEAGYQRGIRQVMVRIQPFTYEFDNLTVLSRVKIFIDFGFDFIPSGTNQLSELENCFFSHISNQLILPYLVPDISKIKNSESQLSNTWYKSTKTYYRLSTKKDGVALLPLSELLEIDSQLLGRNSNKLHLIYGGKEVPLTILNDNDSKINSGDTLVFLGRRSYGDTTWFDNYSEEASFFIYYDDSTNGLRYSPFPVVDSPKNELKSVRVFRHLEKEKVYHRGFPQESSENAPSEGWKWSVISPSMGWDSSIVDTTIIFPAEDNSNLYLSFKFTSNHWNPLFEFQPLHNLFLNYNSNTITNKQYDFRSNDTITGEINNADILSGLNTIALKTRNVYNSNGGIIEPNEIGADYYTLSYNSRPYANSGMAEIEIPGNSFDRNVSIPGFNNSNIIAIDTNNGFITQPVTKQGYFAAVSSKGNLSSIILSSNLYYSSQRGVHINWVSPNSKGTKYFTNPDNNAADFIKQLPKDAFIGIAVNSIEKISSSMLSHFISMGAVKVNQQNGNDNWILAYYPDGYLLEDYQNVYTANLYQFHESGSGFQFSSTIDIPSNTQMSLIISDATNFEKVSVYSVNETDLRDTKNSAEAVLVYHKNFKSSALAYADYRSAYSNIKIYPVDADDIYKEFYFGRKSPHAIKEFLKYVYSNWSGSKLTHLIIWGDASWDVRKIEATSKNTDFISTYGWPASDYWFARFDGDYQPEIKVGRIPVINDEQGFNYIDKLKLMDSVPNNPWMKQFLMIAGGIDQDDLDRLSSFAKYTYSQDNIANTELCADTITVIKTETGATSESKGSTIQKLINKGAEWTYFMGHGSTSVFDIDGWQVEKLNNKGKYGFLATIACNTAAFAEPTLTTRSEDYVLYKEKGFIGSSGSTGVALATNSLNLGLLMLQSLISKTTQVETYVDAMWYAKSKMFYNIWDSLTSDHYTYLGDPLVKLKIQKKPDFYFTPGEIHVTNQNGSELISVSDSIKIDAVLYNLGHRLFKTIQLRLIHEYNGTKDSTEKDFYGMCYPLSFSFNQNVIEQPGIHKFTLIADPENELGDMKFSNNSVQFQKEVFNHGLYPLEPMANWNINPDNPIIRVINPLETINDYSYNFRLFESGDTTALPSASSDTDGDLLVTDDFIDWLPDITLKTDTEYWLVATQKQNNSQSKSPELIIPFYTKNIDIRQSTELKLSTAGTFKKYGSYDNIDISDIAGHAELSLSNKDLNYQIASVYGSVEYKLNRDVEIIFDGNKYILGMPDIVGVKLVVISGDSTKVKAVKIYQTYEDVSDAESMNRFIRDTVQDNDYLLFGTLGESMRGFEYIKFTDPGNPGSLDSLKQILKRCYSTKLSDTLNVDKGAYSFIARKNNKDFVTLEAFSLTDTAKVVGNITRYEKHGSYSTALIGPSVKWKTLKFKSESNSNSSAKLKVNGLNNITNTWDELFASEIFENDFEIDLKAFDAVNYSFISAGIELFRTDESKGSIIKEIMCEYIPAPELLVGKDSKFINSEILRGSIFNADLNVHNISLRTKSSTVDMKLRIESKSKIIDELQVIVPPVEVNSQFQIQAFSATDDYDSENFININLNPGTPVSENYTFNNTQRLILKILEDLVKPSIRLYLDGKEAKDGDYVSKIPFVEVELLDNSPMIIKTPGLIGIGINRPFPTYRDSVFESFGRQTPLKARLSFISDTLDYGENYFRVFVSDNSGNKDTMLVKVFVSQNGIIKDVVAYPNPFEKEMNIEFNLGMQDNNGQIYFEVFNLMGQSVFSSSKNINIGKTDVSWNGYDMNGALAPSGLYTYIIQVKSSTYFEPITGKVILIR